MTLSSKTWLWIILVVVVLLFLGWVWYQQGSAPPFYAQPQSRLAPAASGGDSVADIGRDLNSASLDANFGADFQPLDQDLKNF